MPSQQHQVLAPSNATLGFGTILAVSRPHSRRQPGLLWAANLTDLEIIIPFQSEWTETKLRAFRLGSDSAISEGSARAWLGHLNALRWFLETEKETALVREDDVDWDINVRSHQIPLLASAIRKLLRNASSVHPSAYWVPPSQWDILYPGYCDDALPSSSNAFLTHPRLLYPDATALEHTLLHPDTYNFLRFLRVPESTRLVHRTFAPFCTFAYAVTRSSAARIVREYARKRKGVSAFDVQLLIACREELRCFSVAPELFHHVDGDSVIAGVNNGDGESVDEMGGLGKGTWNVRCGARHGQLWVDEKDVKGREEAENMMREMLERGQQECPIDLVKAERSWKGCEWSECGAQS